MNTLHYDRIIAKVLKHYNQQHESNFTRYDLTRVTRKREVVYIRQLAIYNGKLFTNLSFQQLANPFGLDHATSMHSIRVISNLYDTDKQVKKDVDELRFMFKLDGVVAERKKLSYDPTDFSPEHYSNKMRELAVRRIIAKLNLKALLRNK